MQDNAAASFRRALKAMARRTPFLRRVLRELDEQRSANVALRAERDRAIALQLASDRERDAAEAARWDAVRDREEAERARWAAVADREAAERARWAAVRQREEAEAARRETLLGSRSFPKRDKVEQNPSSGSSASQETATCADFKTQLNGGGQKVQTAAMRISVVLPNYNHGAFINGNIEALRAQTYANWELVIVDDGSTDDSRTTIQSLAQLDERIVPIFLPKNRGALFAFETGLAATTGELLYGSAADDYIANGHFFELVVAALAEHPEAAGVFGKAAVIDASSSKELWRMGSAPAKGLIAPEEALENFLKGGLYVAGAAAIWKRSLIDAIGGFDPTLGPQTDYFVNHALPIVAGAVFIDEIFVAVRSSESNYHRTGNEEDFFRRHALVEAKLRALKLPVPLDPIWLRIWRDRVINSRLAVTRQQQIYQSMRAALTSIQSWEQDGLPADFVECSSRVLADIDRLEGDLEKRVSSVNQVFDAFAGQLGLGGEAPQ